MRRCLCVAAVLVIGVPAFANSFGFPNEVLNPGFDNESSQGVPDPSPWQLSGDQSVSNFGVSPNSAPYYWGKLTSYGSNVVGEAVQWVDNTQSPGWDPNLNQKLIDIEFYAMLHVRHFGSSWENAYIDVSLDWVDPTGAPQEVLLATYSNWEEGLEKKNPEAIGIGNTIEWVPIHLEYLIPDCQPEEISIHFRVWNVDGTEWTYMAVDDVDIESMCVPEPAALSLLALGGVALLRRRR